MKLHCVVRKSERAVNRSIALVSPNMAGGSPVRCRRSGYAQRFLRQHNSPDSNRHSTPLSFQIRFQSFERIESVSQVCFEGISAKHQLSTHPLVLDYPRGPCGLIILRIFGYSDHLLPRRQQPFPFLVQC